MTVLRTVRAAEPTAVFSPQRKYKTVGSNPASATKSLPEHCSGRLYFFTIHFSLFTKLVRECFLEVITHKIQYRLKLSSQKQKLLPTKRQEFYYIFFLFTEGGAYKT